MPSYVTPKYGAAYIFYVTLVDQANTKLFKNTPTLAAGDVRVSIDGGALADLATLPTVTPAAGRRVKVSLSAAEMTGDNVGIMFSDVVGAEWCDLFINLQTSARQIDDLATAASITALNNVSATDILNAIVEGTITLKGALRLALAGLAGKAAGGGSTTITFRDVADTKPRITATVDGNGNRTAVSLDQT